jgi:tetratricopeptide (TPR) repeat protein
MADEPPKTRVTELAICAGIVLVTFISFSGILGNGFTNWDDDRYVTGNLLIRSLSVHGILRIFSPHTLVLASYQPITIFSYALNYAAGQGTPRGYILADLLLHLLNTVLVFTLLRKLSGSALVASLCALVFGIHPMHVESVAWISGRKDLLAAFFYLCSSLFYCYYGARKGRSPTLWYCAACLFCFCALLAKSSAVSLPAFLLLIDYFRSRKVSAGLFVDKIPFVAMAVAIGIWAIMGQNRVGALDSTGALPFYTRISIACYSLMFYVARFFAPIRLAALYPYPPAIAKSLPLAYALSPLSALACIAAAWYFRRSKPFIFGSLFFLVNTIFILHFVPVSGAVTADRFTYLAYIGLAYVIAVYLERGIDRSKLKRVKGTVAALLLGSLSMVFGIMVHERCAVWKSSETLWTDVIDRYPSASAYCNRGSDRLSRRQYAGAIADLDHAIRLDHGYVKAYYDAGLAWQAQNDFGRAIEYYSRALEYDSTNAPAYSSRGIARCMLGDYDRAITDYNRALACDPAYTQARINRGNAFLAEKDYRRAIDDYSQALIREPFAFPQALFNRGLAYIGTGDTVRSVEDFRAACAQHLDIACRAIEGEHP